MVEIAAATPIDKEAPDTPGPGIALCLSGGGYRAMLFHLGALWRLNEAGFLPRLARVSSVSGGSITAGVLGCAWPDLAFDAAGVAHQFNEKVVAPLRRLASHTIDIGAIIGGFLGPGQASDRITAAYRRDLFDRRTLQDLPDDATGPRFVFNATNMQSGVLWRFSRPYARDYRVGKIANPTIEIAVAVAASSAFPPFLSPALLRLKDGDYVRDTGTACKSRPTRRA